MNDRKSDKELADSFDVRDRLLARGYTQEKCGRCKGFGAYPPSFDVQCYTCGGKGWTWRAPISK